MIPVDQTGLQSDRRGPNWFFYMECTPILRIWSGVGDFRLPPDGVDTAGGIYKGIGAVITMPSLRIPINGAMVRHEFVLAGVTADQMNLINADRATVRGARLFLGLMQLTEALQPAAAVVWLWPAIADTPKVQRVGGKDGAVTRTVSLSVGAGEVSRRNRKLGRWTGVDQRKRSADDSFCDRASLYSSQTTERWPT